MKAKLRYEQVYTKRNMRDPIDWVKIEQVRNEGWELLSIFGSLAEAVRNPTIAPVYAIFRQTEMLTSPGADDEIARLKKEIQILKMRDSEPKKTEDKPKISKTTPRKKSRFAATAEKSMARND